MSKEKEEIKEETCFVIMPITDTEEHPAGHFRRVYEDIFKPACLEAGYKPLRADDVLKTNFIQLDIIQKLIESPMAICDLSGRNPNVLYELGIRQAFDKPTVLIQEHGTPQIFDINIFRYTQYNPNLDYREVLRAQQDIAKAINETRSAIGSKDNVNSLIKLMGLKKAEIKNIDADGSSTSKLLLSEIANLKREIFAYSQQLTNKSQIPYSDAFIHELDVFEKGIAHLETSIAAGFSKVILKGLYDGLSNEYSRLQSSGINSSTVYNSVLSQLYARLSSFYWNVN